MPTTTIVLITSVPEFYICPLDLRTDAPLIHPGIYNLDHEPHPQHENCRHADDLNKEENRDKNVDAGTGERGQVGTQDAGNRAAGSNKRHDRARSGSDVRKGGNDTTQQVEHEESPVPEDILDVIPEDPEIEHIACDVEPPTVHKK